MRSALPVASCQVPVQTRGCRRTRARRGLSIVEVLVSITIVAMLLTAVAAAFSASSQIIDQNDQFFRATQAARVSLNQMLTEIRRSQAVSLPSYTEIDLITFDGQDQIYVYSPTNEIIKLITTGNINDPGYRLACNVTSCSFAADTQVDKGGISHVVRVSISMVVQVGTNTIRLDGSAAPRREQTY